MIRYGIAGIPLTSKGRTFVESVEDAANIGLNALEVQLLRVNVQENQVLEYSGMLPKDVENSIIIDILRQDENGNYVSIGNESAIQEDDIVQELFWNMAKNYDELKEGGELAKELDVLLSLHAPYYMDLLEGGEIAESSLNHLKWSMIIGKAMDSKRIISHSGFYRGTKKNSLKIANNTFSDFIKKYGPDKNFPILGIETSGKPEIFGTVDEVISLAKAIPEIEPILNVPHAHALNGGNLIEGKDFKSILDKFQPYAKGDLYLEYAGVEYDDTGEKKLTAIKHGDLKFETFSEILMDYDKDLTLISCSPLLEHDAQYMNLIFMRNYYRHMQRKQTQKK
jgi:deoxyribonuclease-4